MCIVFVTHEPNGLCNGGGNGQRSCYKWIIASNRDELIDRPTGSVDFYDLNGIKVLAGRDLKGGGTWLGINEFGSIVMVTNNREAPYRPAQESRGALSNKILTSCDLDKTFSNEIIKEKANYSSFNILSIEACNGDLVRYFSSQDEKTDTALLLEQDSFSLSNGGINREWPKMREGARLVKKILNDSQSSDTFLIESIISNVLTSTKTFSKDLLPKNTILDPDVEEQLSSIFIKPFKLGLSVDSVERDGLFGTVSSSIVLVGDGYAEFMEVSWRPLLRRALQEGLGILDDKEVLLNYYRKNVCKKVIHFQPLQ